MSSSDIFDVLNIKKAKSPADATGASAAAGPGGASSTPPTAGTTVVPGGPKQPLTGMRRELYNLLGENQPPMMVQPSSKFKETLKSATKASPWTRGAFKANAHLTLTHWVKGSQELLGDEPQESAYAKFDQHMSLPEFTREEFESFMKGDKGAETKDTETKESEKKDSEAKDTEAKDTEVKDTEPKNSETKDSETKESESKDIETKEIETKETETKETEVIEAEAKESESKDTEAKEAETKEPEVKESEAKESETQDTESKDTETKETDDEEADTKNAETEDTETKDTETKDTEAQDAETQESEDKDTEAAELGVTDSTATEQKTTDTNAADNAADTQTSETKSSDAPQQEEATADPAAWTYEEVEYLFHLCRTYDLRWFVIWDRYAYGSVERTLEELKQEFYLVSRRYFESKNAAEPLLQSLEYPASRERERKAYLERLLSRSAAEIAEEEALVIESRKFEMGARKMLQEREALLRLLDSPNSEQSVAQYMTSQGMSQLYGSLLADKTRKRRHEGAIPENPWMKQQQQFAYQKQQQQQQQLAAHKQQSRRRESNTAEGTGSVTPTPAGSVPSADSAAPRRTKKQKLEQQSALKRKSEVEYAENLLKGLSAEERKSLGVQLHGEKLSPGVYLRSTRISTFKPTLQNKVHGVLQELKLPVRPAMPSAAVVSHQEVLLERIVQLTELKKSLDKLAAEHSVAGA
ncbi:Swc4 protein [Maudiozyma humilis]|uniref:SWR1-complex protein 4 n=1 Tax=Maudiozyma humilis TaxID=51915 RepID=A0AAV5S1Q4_MAUHU|nr:Swc4 protein [Kazachstania humilis]